MRKISRKRLNDLDGKTWFSFSFSIWRDIRKSSEEMKLSHPAIFPIALTSRIIKIFTTKDATVLDPFMGCGSTIISAILEKRKGIGIDLSKEYYEITKKRIDNLGLKLFEPDFHKPQIYNDDARNILKYVTRSSIDLCVTSPPYWNILTEQRTSDRKEAISYSNSKKDLGNIGDYDKFLEELKVIFKKIHEVLKENGYCVVVVMDIRKRDKFYSFHSDIAQKMKEIGFAFEDIIIWDRQHEYNNMRPIGYPYAFRVNKVHEYLLIFKKVKENVES
jgi:DNA modification methylase